VTVLPVIGVALIIGVSFLMAFGEESNWVRGGLRNLAMWGVFVMIGLGCALVAYVI
jgi:hypothetical protein